MRAGDVASLIFHAGSLDETAFQRAVEPLIPLAQEEQVASLICDHSRVAGRIGADGLQLGQDPDALREAIGKFAPRMMVGAGNVKTRHNALVLGQAEPDYLMFGKPGGDTRQQPHPRNLELGQWWASMVEIPCIVLGGNVLESIVEAAQTGAEFVALSDAIFAPQDAAIETGTMDMAAVDTRTREAGAIDAETVAARVEEANRLLDAHAPRFDEE